jgi:hypothetical protein
MRKSSASRVGPLTPRLRDDRVPKSITLPGARGCLEEPQLTGTAVLTRERRRPQPPLSSFGQFGLVCCAADEGIDCHMVR